MSIADKLTTIAENQHRIYQAGYDKGKAEGGEVGDDYVFNAPPSAIKTYTDTRSAGFAENAFKDFTELESVYAPHAEVIGAHAFDGCSKLTSLQLGDVIEVGEYAFNGCGIREFEAFKYVKYSFREGCSTANTCGVSAFSNCVNLEKVDFHWFENSIPFIGAFGESNCAAIPSKCFSGCTNLKTFILRQEQQVELADATVFEGTAIENGTGYIYAQSKHIDYYKTGSNWSAYANQIRTLEDYTVDGTVDGELDETKI